MLLGGAGTVNCPNHEVGVQHNLSVHAPYYRSMFVDDAARGRRIGSLCLLSGGCPVVRLTFGGAESHGTGNAFSARTLLLVATYQSLLLEMPA
jgi:hypothetical protein